MSAVLQRIDARLKDVGLTRQAASIKAGLGKDYIRDLARSKNGSPGLAAIEKLAPVLETTVDWLRGADQALNTAGIYRPPPAALGDEDLPLYRSVEGGPGYIVVTEMPMGVTDRPKRLEGNKDAFAVVVAGESMVPVYEPGDLLLVDPYKPLVRNRNFIFIDDRHGDWKACVKKLIAWDEHKFNVWQHNPPDGQESRFFLEKSEWPKAYRVLGKLDGD